jgi:hypothetical protein
MVSLNDAQLALVMTAARPLPPDKRSVLLERIAGHLGQLGFGVCKIPMLSTPWRPRCAAYYTRRRREVMAVSVRSARRSRRRALTRRFEAHFDTKGARSAHKEQERASRSGLRSRNMQPDCALTPA